MQRNRHAFTLIEIAISVSILLLLLLLAVPSVNGVLADRKLRRSLDALNILVRTAQERSVTDHRPYLISWGKDQLVLRTAAAEKGEDPAPTAVLKLQRGEAYLLKLPAALTEDPPANWIFWPSGICEPATVSYKGPDGRWTANYSPLTAHPELSNYGAK